jgi:hypothetical protein
MRHTSVRLSNEHAERIMEMGESPTVIIRKALDLYFGMASSDLEPTRWLIDEAIQRHVKACHKDEHKISTCAQNEHVVRTNKSLSESVPAGEHKVSTQAQSKHVMSTRAQNEPTMSTEVKNALTLILDELRAGHEPTVNQIADEVGLTTTGLGRGLSKLGIKSKNTHRDMQTVRLYPKTLMPRIEEILADWTEGVDLIDP